MALTDLLNFTLPKQNTLNKEEISVDLSTNKDELLELPFDENFLDMQYATEEEIDEWYSNWISDKNGYGIRTTGLRNGEVNFAEYGAALSDELQNEIQSYFEEGAINRDEAIEAQQKIAALYGNKSNLSYNEFVAAVKSLGYDISREYVNTSYIIDDKKSRADHGGELTTGNIAVFSIKNKDGETLFKIADSNGNAAIEIEEVFMNELLSGISNKIDTATFKAAAATAGSLYATSAASSAQQAISVDVENETNSYDEKTKTKDGKHIITQVQYDRLTNEKVELLIQKGYKESEAKAEAKKFMDKNYTIDNSSTNKAVKVAGFYTSITQINNHNDDKETKEIIEEEEVKILNEEEELIV